MQKIINEKISFKVSKLTWSRERIGNALCFIIHLHNFYNAFLIEMKRVKTKLTWTIHFDFITTNPSNSHETSRDYCKVLL